MNHNLHVQIALVGNQPTPVYQGIVHMHPDKVILVCSTQTREVADAIKQQLPSYEDRDIEIRLLSDTDISAMYETIENFERNVPENVDLSINISGGMKLWSLIFHEVFSPRHQDCSMFFIGQNGTFFDLHKRTAAGKVAFDMDAQFRILGHTLDDYTTLSEYTDQDDKSFFKILKMVRDKDTKKAFKDITFKFVEEYKKKHGTNEVFVRPFSADNGDDFLSWYPDANEFIYSIAGKEGKFHSPHISHLVLKTGWFEYNVARMMGEIYGSENVHLNCTFRSEQNVTKNEIDVIVNTGSKLIFVECKTQVFNITDIDKFRSAVRNYGGLGSKPLFVTNWEMIPDGQEKCKELRITTFYTNNHEYHSQEERVNALKEVLKKLDKDWNV